MEKIQTMTKKTFELISSIELIKAASDDDTSLYIKGYANTTKKDRTNDVVVEEAWTKGGIDNYKKNPILLAFHDHARPIGTATSISVDKGGIEIVGKISKAAGDVYELVKEGILKAFSVGFIVKDADYDSKTDVFVIKDLELLEISVVSVPANQDSIFSLSKSFDSEEEYLEFKKSFISQEEKPVSTTDKEIEQSSDSEKPNEDKEFSMDPVELQKMIEAAATAAATKAADAANAAATAAAKSVEVGQSGAEKLLADVEKRLADNDTTVSKALEDLRGELAEKSNELKALQESKMKFEEKSAGDKISMKEKETAVILAKAMGKPLETTKAFEQLVQKYGAHLPSADWEDTVSTNMLEEIRRRLVIQPLFRGITMTGSIMKLPVNPEAGYANWVTPTSYMAAASSGTAQTHSLKEISISAHKLATKEFLGNEEDYDSILPLVPIIRDAMVRRTAKAIDKGLLLDTGSYPTPLKGITQYQTSSAHVTVTTTAKVTVANLQTLRKNLGVWGLDPSDVVYVVGSDAYFDLLEDTNFLTMDKVGTRATILTGQIGMVNGSPVLVSGEFAAKAGGTAGSVGAVALNANNFMVGNYRGLTMESDYNVEYQMRLMVASLRMGFQQISTVDGHAVSCLRWT
jgi:HK97 family phage prohead protease/HK97 family phage major capsid protein